MDEPINIPTPTFTLPKPSEASLATEALAKAAAKDGDTFIIKSESGKKSSPQKVSGGLKNFLPVGAIIIFILAAAAGTIIIRERQAPKRAEVAPGCHAENTISHFSSNLTACTAAAPYHCTLGGQNVCFPNSDVCTESPNTCATDDWSCCQHAPIPTATPVPIRIPCGGGCDSIKRCQDAYKCYNGVCGLSCSASYSDTTPPCDCYIAPSSTPIPPTTTPVPKEGIPCGGGCDNEYKKCRSNFTCTNEGICGLPCGDKFDTTPPCVCFTLPSSTPVPPIPTVCPIYRGDTCGDYLWGSSCKYTQTKCGACQIVQGRACGIAPNWFNCSDYTCIDASAKCCPTGPSSTPIPKNHCERCDSSGLPIYTCQSPYHCENCGGVYKCVGGTVGGCNECLTPIPTPTATPTTAHGPTATSTSTPIPGTCACTIVKLLNASNQEVSASSVTAGQQVRIFITYTGTNVSGGRIKVHKGDGINIIAGCTLASGWCVATHATPPTTPTAGYYVDFIIPTEPGTYMVEGEIFCNGTWK